MENTRPKAGGALRSWLIVALVAFAFFSLYRMNPDTPQTHELTQLDFLRALEKGEIIEPVTRFLDRDSGVTRLEGKMHLPDAVLAQGSEEEDGKATPGTVEYRVPLVPGESEELMNALLKRGVQVAIVEKRSPLSPFIVQTLFFFGSLALIWFLMRRMSGVGGPGGGIFGMGKSRAKVLDAREDKKLTTFGDVAGIDEAKEEVQEIIEFLKAPDEFKKLGGKIPKGVLLVGPPGTGKTLLARAIAGEAKVPFFSISGSDFEDMFVGVGASRMRDMFAEAKKRSPCIVFIDEIDSIGQKRSAAGAFNSSMSHDQTLNTMLVEMDGFDANEGVIVIAATNRPETLDAALLRPGRFDRQVVIDLPTLKGREEILNLHGKHIKFGPDADLQRVARGTPGFSGADLANLLNEAALLAVRKKLDAVDMATLEEARDKVLWGRERKSAGYAPREREITAWHEAGHTILQLLLKNTDPLHKVTIIPRGRALGATMSLPEKDVLGRSKSYFLDQMIVCCGGRIGEKLFTDDISTGAAQDIRQATEIARKMVCSFGMSDKFGFQAFLEPNRFSDTELPPAFSEETAREIDNEVSRLVNNAYTQAEKLISKNRDKLELLAKTLIERETMDAKDVKELLDISDL